MPGKPITNNQEVGMETVRLIVCSKPNLEGESITITEDFETPAKDFCSSTWTVDIDKKIEMEIPLGFPMDHTFER